MQRTRTISLLVSVVLAVGAGLLPGCAAPGEGELVEEPAVAEAVAEAPAPEAPAAPQALQKAEEAFQDEDYELAERLLAELLAEPEGLTDEQIVAARNRLGRARSILHQQEVERQEAAARTEAVAEAEAAEAEAQAAAPEEVEPEPAPLEPEAARTMAVGRMEAIEQLCAEQKCAEAVALFEGLDELRQHLSVEQKLRYDLLWQLVQEATGELTLAKRQKVERGEEHLAIADEAEEADDYLKASEHLKAAAGFDVSLGWLDNRKLRKLCQEVDGTLDALRAQFETGKRLKEEGDLDGARAALAAVAESPISIGEGEAQEAAALVKQIERELAERELAEAERQREAASALLGQAGQQVEAGNYEAASAALAELSQMQDYLSQEQAAAYGQLCAALEEATGVSPAMEPAERIAVAEDYYDRGMQAYEERRFAEARDLLQKAARLDVDLGRRRNRRLSDRLQEVQEGLTALREDLATAEQLLEGGEYGEARRVLRSVADCGIHIGDEQMARVDALLAQTERLLAEQEAQREQERRDRAAKLLAEAKTLAAEGNHPGAAARLEALDDMGPYLTEEQGAQVAALREVLAGAAEAAEVEMRLKRAEQLAARAGELLQVRSSVQASVARGDAAREAGDLAAAEELFLQAQQALLELDLEGLAALGELAREVEGKLASVRTEAARVADVMARRAGLAALVDEARRLADTDLLDAERKVVVFLDYAEREGLELTAEQEAVARSVRQAVEGRHGPERRLRPELYADLVEQAERYRDAAEYGKAAQALALVRDAPEGMITEEFRNHALGRLTAVEHEQAEQQQAAGRLVGLLAECRADAARGELREALEKAEAIVQMTGEEPLAGEPLAGVLRQTAAFLAGEFEDGLTQTYAGVEQVAAEGLARTRLAVARDLSQFYLRNLEPELARPYLKQLAAAPDSADWAAARLERLDTMETEAAQARLAHVKGEAARVLELAQRLHDLAREGMLDEAEAVRRELAEARLDLQVKKARAAIDRGAYTEASRLLDEAPVAEATPKAVEELYRPVAERLERLRTVAARLGQAEQAFEDFSASAVAAHLREAAAVEVESEPLAIKREALAALLDAVLDVQEARIALAAQKERLAQDVAAHLARVETREEAWQRYRAALAMFLKGEGGAAAAAAAVVSAPQALRPFEVDAARDVHEALAGSMAPAPTEGAERKLAEARAAYALEDYARAADLLTELEAMAAGKTIQAEARKLREQVRRKEQEAERLYAEAVEAYEEQDVERVRRLTRRLKDDYANTRSYRRHR
jgi:hypothetical protein